MLTPQTVNELLDALRDASSYGAGNWSQLELALQEELKEVNAQALGFEAWWVTSCLKDGIAPEDAAPFCKDLAEGAFLAGRLPREEAPAFE